MEAKRLNAALGWTLAGVFALGCSPWAALMADQEEPDVPPATREAEPTLEGFWPTQRMMGYAVQRWCDQVSYDYSLDDEQHARLQEMMQRRWPAWMEENRRELQPLINEFMENRIAPEPPSPELVADWAGRALDMFQRGREELRAAQADFREYLTPRQKMKFDADVTKINVGMELFEQKLRGWSGGRYARHELWDAPHWLREQERRQAEQRAAPATPGEAGAAPPEPEAAPEPSGLDMWESYVATFIKTYGLDDEQVTRAWAIMGDLRARADRHRERHEAEYTRIEARLAAAEGDARQEWQARQAELDQPLAQLFDELKDKLDRLLTDAQRRAVEQTPDPQAETASSNS